MAGAPLVRPRGTNRPVADHAVEPPDDVVGDWPLAHELQEGVLHDVLRRVAPLLGVQHQGGAVLVEQSRQQFRPGFVHRCLYHGFPE